MAKKPPGLRVVGGGNFTPPEDVEGMAKAKLASSGISLVDARLLGMSWHSAAETVAYTPTAWALPSLRLPYYQPNSAHGPLSAVPGASPFYRLRALRDPIPKPDDFAKYLQGSNTGTCAYFPRTIDWDAVLQDTSIEITITEGELKAAKACLEGLTAIGLGGVNSYKASKLGSMELLPELRGFNWVFRSVLIVYDSDVMRNPRVCQALNDLSEVLVAHGAVPRMVVLPEIPDRDKTGLDDFLVEYGVVRFQNFVTSTSMHVTIAKPLFRLNSEYAFVRTMGERLVNLGSGYLLSPAALKLTVTDRVLENVITPTGVVKEKPVSAAAYWLRWGLRQEVERLVYLPHLPPNTIVPNPEAHLPGACPYVYNTWTGWGVAPKKGSVALFLKIVDHVLSGAEPAFKHWVLQWFAYPIQHPGTKLFSSLILHGSGQGTGKSVLGYTMAAIYGKNFIEISQDDLHGSFNEWAIGRQFVMGDDVTGYGQEKRQDLDRIKKAITQHSLRVNAKNQPTYSIIDCINYYWTSNHADAFALEDYDRRFAVHHVTAAPLPDEFWVEYFAWLRGPGAAAVHYYFAHYDLTGFNPASKAMASSAKEVMKRASRGPAGNWVRDLLDNPDKMLMLRSGAPMIGDLFSITQLAALYADYAGEDEGRRITTNMLARELGRASCLQVHGGNPVNVRDQKLDRYYPIRNRDKWMRASLAQLQAHLQGEDVPKPPAKRKPKPS